jgi:hypothetical protein
MYVLHICLSEVRCWSWLAIPVRSVGVTIRGPIRSSGRGSPTSGRGRKYLAGLPSRGLLFYRLLQQAAGTDPHPLSELIGGTGNDWDEPTDD